jgi:hypothetical protein
MKIGANYSFLSLERVGRRGPYLFLRLAAALLGPGWRFTAAHERMKVSAEKDTLKEIADFAARKTRRLTVALRYGGWIRIRRYRNGHILVRYRVCHAGAGAAMEGEACLTGGSAESFCSGLGEPLPGRVNT